MSETEQNNTIYVALPETAALCAWSIGGILKMGGIIYLVGLVVVVMAVLSLIGLG
jgi:hypothetical protein